MYSPRRNCLIRSGIWESIGDIATVHSTYQEIREKIEFNTSKPPVYRDDLGRGDTALRFKMGIECRL